MKKNDRPVIVILILVIIGIIAVDATLLIQMTSHKKYDRSQGIKAYEEGEYTAAYTYFENALEEKQWFSKTIDSDILRYQADICIKQQDYENALRLIAQSRELANKKDLRSLECMEKIANAMLLYQQEQYEDAKTAFEELISLGYKEYLYHVANCCEKLNQYDDMLRIYQEYIDACGGNSLVYAELAAYYLNENDLTTAKSYIDSAIACDDEYVQRAQFLNVVYYEKQNELSTAFTMVSDYLEKYPEDEKAQEEYDFLESRAAGLKK